MGSAFFGLFHVWALPFKVYPMLPLWTRPASGSLTLYLHECLRAGGQRMCSRIENHRAGSVSAILPLLPVLLMAVWAVTIAKPALAQDGASHTAPRSQGDSGYWTKQRMRSAKPLMPTVPGTPQGGSWTSGPSGPPGGSPGQGPTVPPQSSGAATKIPASRSQ
jgi:hypothetical protein